MWPISNQSFFFGFWIAFLCIFIAAVSRFSVAHFNWLAETKAVKYKWIGNLLEIFLLVSVLSAIALHPALVTVYLYSISDFFPTLSIFLANLNMKPIGIIIIGTFLHLPIAYLWMRSIPIENLMLGWRKAKLFSLSPLPSFVSFVGQPLLLEIIPFFLFFVIMIEGMVFVPQLSMANEKEIIGRALFDAVTSFKVGTNTARALSFFFFVKILTTGFIGYLLNSNRSRLLGYGSLIVFRVYWRFRKIIDIIVDISRFLFWIGVLAVSVPVLAVFCVECLLLGAFIKMVFQGVFHYGLPELWLFATSGTWDTPLVPAAINTAVVAIFGSTLAAIIIFLLITWAGKIDGWKRGKMSNFIAILCTSGALVPASLYAFCVQDFMRKYPLLTLISVLGWIGICMGMLTLGNGIRNLVYSLERIRESLSLRWVSYWIQTSSLIAREVGVLFLWISLLLWNDVSVQLFAKPNYNGLPTHLLSLGRDGLSPEIKASLAVLQVVLLGAVVPFFVVLRHKLSLIWKA